MFEDFEIVDPESPGMDDDTPMHVAAMDGRLDLLEDMMPFVRNIDVPGDIGNTPLHYAALFRQVEAARFLLQHGADLMRGNDYGDTPLGWMADHPAFAGSLPAGRKEPMGGRSEIRVPSDPGDATRAPRP